jgi:hypothetical protein
VAKKYLNKLLSGSFLCSSLIGCNTPQEGSIGSSHSTEYFARPPLKIKPYQYKLENGGDHPLFSKEQVITDYTDPLPYNLLSFTLERWLEGENGDYKWYRSAPVQSINFLTKYLIDNYNLNPSKIEFRQIVQSEQKDSFFIFYAYQKGFNKDGLFRHLQEIIFETDLNFFKNNIDENCIKNVYTQKGVCELGGDFL